MSRANEGEVVTVFRKYAACFQSLDPRATSLHFQEPAMLITPDSVMALPDLAAVERAYAHVMSGLPDRGYARTEFFRLTETRLSPSLAIVSGAGAWKNQVDAELSRFGVTYLFRLGDAGWRIVTAVIHDELPA